MAYEPCAANNQSLKFAVFCIQSKDYIVDDTFR